MTTYNKEHNEAAHTHKKKQPRTPEPKFIAKDLFDSKKELSKGKVKLIFLLCLFGASWLFNLGWAWFLGLIFAYSVVDAFNKFGLKQPKALIITISVSAFWTVFIYVIAISVGILWGAIGLLIFSLIMGVWIIWRKRDLYMRGIRSIETQLFGKPLDKKLWTKKEYKDFKRTKHKLVWKKTKKEEQ